MASREQAHLAGLADAVAPAPVVWVPFLRSDVHDLAGLDEVAAPRLRTAAAGLSGPAASAARLLVDGGGGLVEGGGAPTRRSR